MTRSAGVLTVAILLVSAILIVAVTGSTEVVTVIICLVTVGCIRTVVLKIGDTVLI